MHPHRLPRPFHDALLRWFDQHGRHDLPWQRARSPYRVWVAEIMLQQTQVKTVIPYFERFMARFPTLTTLADASLDDVLHLWTGLGYYARGRHLHRAARQVCSHHGGTLPETLDALTALPGIARSTAGAILAQACQQRHPILDGNVKRVLSRYHAIAGWPGHKTVENQLWALSEHHTPATRCADYTQAIMDLGATVCTHTRPACARCPIATRCRAHAEGNPGTYPTAKPYKALPVRRTAMLLLEDTHGRVLLERRPLSGIWGGLWSLPECPAHTNDIEGWCHTHLHLRVEAVAHWPTLRHTFSHFHLDIHPLHVHLRSNATTSVRQKTTPAAGEAPAVTPPGQVWYNTRQPDARGLPAPIKRLLETLATAP